MQPPRLSPLAPPFGRPRAAARGAGRPAAWLALALGLGCHRPPPPEVAARVGTAVITEAAFTAELDRTLARYQGSAQPLPPGIEARIHESVLGRMIDEQVMAQEAARLGLRADPAEVEARLAEHRQRFVSEASFADFLARSHSTVDELKADLGRALLRDRVVAHLGGEPTVSEAEVAEYYQANQARFMEPESLRARRILVRLPPDLAPAERRRREARAQDAARRLRRPKADFARLARQLSDGPEAADGGDLGPPFARGQLTPELDEVAFALAPGKIAGPIPTRLGLEIIEVTERHPARLKPLAEVATELRASLVARARNDRRREILQQIRERAHIEQPLDLGARAAARAEAAAAAAGRPSGG